MRTGRGPGRPSTDVSATLGAAAAALCVGTRPAIAAPSDKQAPRDAAAKRARVALVLDRGEVGRAVQASSSLPGLFEPVRIDGRLCIDGNLAAPVPVTVELKAN